MTTDFLLASGHHIFVFALMALLAAELVLVRPGLTADAINRIARIDGAYGAMSLAVILIGVARVIWGIKGYEAYITNVWFWHKMAVFLLVGILSIMPTMRFVRWRKAAAADAAYAVPADEVKAARRFIHAEAGLFLLIPVFAAAMARFGA